MTRLANGWLLVVAACALAMAGCVRNVDEPVTGVVSETDPISEPAIVVARPVSLVEVDVEDSEPEGLVLELGNAGEVSASGTREPDAPIVTVPLDAARIAELLARVPALGQATPRVPSFAFPAPTLSPERPGDHVTSTVADLDATRPPPEIAAANPTAPLTVLRTTPSGEAHGPISTISITFSAPMVPLTSITELEALDVPVTLEPEVAGRWRWLGTSTLVFEADTRLPMASHITATVSAANARSVHGQTLDDDVSFIVSTQPPQITSILPNGHSGPQVRQPVIIFTADQPIDAAAVLPFITIDGAGWANWGDVAFRLATDEERDGALSTDNESPVHHPARGRTWDPDRMIAIIPEAALKLDADLDVSVRAGFPGREGPRTSRSGFAEIIAIHDDFTVTETRCGWRGDCTAGTGWQIGFSNPIDATTFREDQLTLEPAARIFNASVSGNRLYVQADTRGNTTYELTIDPELRDVFGQALGDHRDIEFSVEPAPPELRGSFETQVADPFAPRRFGIVTRNIKRFEVVVLKTTATQWTQFSELRRVWNDEDMRIDLPGTIAIDAKVDVVSSLDERVITHIDLTPALNESKLGHVIVCVRALDVSSDRFGRRAKDSKTGRRWDSLTWVQNTNLAVDETVDDEGTHVFVSLLDTGAPVGGASIELDLAGGQSGVTNENGVVHLENERSRVIRPLIATLGDDSAFVASRSGYAGTHEDDDVRWVFVDDRHLYKPGETVRVKGWARRLDTNKHGDVSGVVGWIQEVKWTATDARRVELAKGTAVPSDRGGFDLAFDLPEGVNLGNVSIRFQHRFEGRDTYESRWAQHVVSVQEFRRPEFEVSLAVDEGPHVVGGDATATVSGRYFTGGALPDADVSWSVSTSTASYAPPGWDQFTFGTWVPWWRSWHGNSSSSPTLAWTATTDADGEHALALNFVEVKPPRASTVSLNATITDVNRQAWSASKSFVVHAADQYVGLRTERSYLSAGEPIEGSFVVTDIDGEVVANRPVQIAAVLKSYKQVSGEWKQVEIARRELNVASSADGATDFALLADGDDETALGGRWSVTATVTDGAGRVNASERTLWAAGGAPPVVATEGLPFEDIELVPDAKEYEAGDVAKLLVQSPFAPAYGVMTVLREGVIEERALVLEEPTTVLEIPIDDSMVPNIYVHVELVGAKPRDVGVLEISDSVLDPPPRPAYASGELMLSVPPIRRALDIAIAPRDEILNPGASTVLDLRVTGHDGEPVSDAEVAVIVVDEALYALSGHAVPDPLGVLYPNRSSDTQFVRGRSDVRLSSVRWDDAAGEWRFASLDDDDDAEDLFEGEALQGLRSLGYIDGSVDSAPMATAAFAARGRKGVALEALGYLADDAAPESAAGGDSSPIAVRSNFDAVAAWVPDALTDGAGNIAVSIEMPDSLTRYRIIAVALDPNRRAGKSEGAMTVRMPLMVRPSAPRFLSWGDTCELPVVLQNGMSEDMTVDLALSASNATLTSGAGQRVTVPANDRVELRFGVATADVGEAAFQFVASADGHADAAKVSFPVWTPGTSETFAAVGVVDEGGVAQTVRMPDNVLTAFGGLEVSTSSTALASLSDAFLYLYDYPYACTEQLASRTLGTLAMLDVVEAWTGLEGMPTRSEVLARVQVDMEEVGRRQLPSGGFGWWSSAEEAQPYLSVHTAAALVAAREADVDVSIPVLDKALDVLTNLPYRNEYERRVVAAYACSVLARAGKKPWGMVRDEIARQSVAKLPADSLSWLLHATSFAGGTLAAERTALERELLNRVHESTSKAHITTNASEENGFVLLSSDRRSDALATTALIATNPSSDAIVKLVRGLQGARLKGRWRTTQENVFVLGALRAYFDAYESEAPDFVASTWLGNRFAGSAAFEGRTALQSHLDIPLSTVASLASPMLDDSEPAQDVPLVIAKEGTGRLYWRAALRTAPENLTLDPADAGFTVTRLYEAVDDPDDVHRDADGVWHVRAGANVRVTVTMTTPMVRHHVALVDPLPGGFEAVNPAFKSSPSIGGALDEEQSLPWWRRVWYQHQNLRDERAESFATYVWPGAYSYRYVARATTPGRFVAGPAKAEEMYEPETFGRSSTDIVIVTPPGQ